jgi:hypothetical protein
VVVYERVLGKNEAKVRFLFVPTTNRVVTLMNPPLLCSQDVESQQESSSRSARAIVRDSYFWLKFIARFYARSGFGTCR